jgi:hypothetical protein
VSDEDLGIALRSLLATVDPVPEAALRAAYAAIGWRDLDANLARLTHEVGLDRELLHLRGAPPRLLTFSSGETTIELEVSADGGQVRLLGQLEPAGAADVTVQCISGSRTTQADDRGRFSISDLSDGWMRVAVAFTGTSGAGSTSEWFRV